MINENELRIGNWFQCDEWDDGNIKFYKVSELSKNCIRAENSAGVFGKANGIPLSPEILLKNCGFKVAYESYHEGISIMNLHTDRLSFQYHSEYDKGMSVSVKEEDSAIMFPCKYLHQLQNLYYCLTGKKIDITL